MIAQQALDFDSAIKALEAYDRHYPRPPILDILEDARNAHLLEYVYKDAFGAHVFPGNLENYSAQGFLANINEQLKDNKPIHLWLNIPLCETRCAYCQFPTVIFTGKNRKQSTQWVEANIAEAKLWLEAIPNLRSAPIGEFNIFGGTPSLLSQDELDVLLNFYQGHFNFTEETTLRFEGNPKSLTKELLAFLRRRGFTKLSFGIQSFDDRILTGCGCPHRVEDIRRCITDAQSLGFERISADLIYGLLNQSVASVERDIQQAIQMDLTAIVCTKLHLKTFNEAGTSVSGQKHAAWQYKGYRDRLAKYNHHWPSLSEQYQMRDVIVDHLEKAGYFERPTMYFTKQGHPSEKWKSLMVDQDKQYVEISIGLGGSSSCQKSQALNEVDKHLYFEKLQRNQLPLDEIKGFDSFEQEKKSVRMALSTCAPLADELHQVRFPQSSLFATYWHDKFSSLQNRGLASIDEKNRTFTLTKTGKTLVEAIINTEIT